MSYFGYSRVTSEYASSLLLLFGRNWVGVMPKTMRREVTMQDGAYSLVKERKRVVTIAVCIWELSTKRENAVTMAI